ncbi:MAG: 4-hydroxy-tetrahydrodipicolinate synthase [Euryarchaeota archaeon]|nr:4-hydroxy-tetrahydrodipicolinate synthase [Euryarchaeota archaeon]
MFSGLATALITPMLADSSIDEEGLRQLVRFQEDRGVQALIPCGSTGESATLNHEEHLEVIKIVIDEAKSAKIIAGTGSNSTIEAVHLSKGAQDLGADALLSVSPYYNRPTSTGIINHFEAISDAVDIPIIVYNIPSRTGSNIVSSTMLELAKLPNIAGVKEASGDIAQIARIVAGAPKDFVVLSGDDVMTLPAMALGAKGVISVSSNIIPELMLRMVNAMLEGRLEDARQINKELMPLFSALFLETNPQPVKTAARLMGLPAGPLRMPLCEMDARNLESLKKILAQYKLI